MNLFKYMTLIMYMTFISAQGHDHDHDNHHGGIIRGSIIDSITGKSKKYANISIVKEDSDDIIDGGISDEEGMFLIDDIPYGKYYVVIEYIGYDDYIIDDIAIYPTNLTIDLGVVMINQKMILIDGVSVIESAPIIEDIEKTTYPVAETARASGGAADEVLEQLPSISVDMDGNIALRGNTNVTILIDGRKSSIEVDMLNANMIEKVEVMTTPSAKYDPDGMAGIINIILNKNEFVGNSGNLNFNQSSFQGSRGYNGDDLADGGQNLSGTLNFFKNDWNIFTTYSLKAKHREGGGLRNTTSYNDDEEEILNNISDESIHSHPERSNFKMGIEHYPNDKALIAFDLTYIMHKGLDTTRTNITSDSELLPEITTYGDEGGEDLNYGFGYFRDNKEENKSFSVEFDYDDHDDHEGKIFEEEGTDDIIQGHVDNGVSKIFSVDYSAPILNGLEKDSHYEIGLKWNNEKDIHTTTVQDQKFTWNYDNQIYAMYFNTAYYFTESFGMQIGGRLEDQEKHSVIDYIIDANFENPLFPEVLEWIADQVPGECLDGTICNSYKHEPNPRIYPSLYLLYDTQGSGNLKFELGRRINRPWHRALDPIPDLTEADSRFIQMGNPFLKPEDIYKSEISYSNRTPFGFLKTGIYYNQVTDKIDRDIKTESFYNGIDTHLYSILTWDNIAESTELGMEVTFMTKPLPNIDLMLNGNYWHHNFEISYNDEADQLGAEYGFWGMMTSQIRLQNDQQLSIYAHYSTPMKIITGEISPFKRMDISYKKKVNDKFNFTIKLKDVFDTGGFAIVTDQISEIYNSENDDPDQIHTTHLVADHRRNKRSLSFNLEYRFGAFQKKKYRREEGGGHSHDGGEGTDAGY